MFWRRKRPQADFQEEIRSHLEMDADELGDPDAARRAFGNVTSFEERYFERSRWLWWDHLRQDVRYAIRTLLRAPVFSVAAIVILALGIGANTAIFSVLRGVLLKPLSYEDPERIMVLEPFFKNSGKTGTLVSAPDFHDWRSQNRVFDSMAYYQQAIGTAMVNGVPFFVTGQVVTPDFFAVFGLPPQAGRFWSESENRAAVAVVSHRWAHEQFGSAQLAIGKRITAAGKAVEVIGVTRSGFHYPGASDIWAPAGLAERIPTAPAITISRLAS